MAAKTQKIQNSSLTDVCDITLHPVLENHQIINGKYAVIDSNGKVINHHNNFNCDENTVICALDGKISRNSSKIWASGCYTIKPKDSKVLDNNYLYYYLSTIKKNMFQK